jgi:hypothetical protein
MAARMEGRMSIEFCVSEAEAFKKYCARALKDPCIGSRCMAWRWVETNVSDGRGGLKPSTDTHGYCGLAGKPWGVR